MKFTRLRAALTGLLMLAAGLSVQAAVASAASASTGGYPFMNAVCQSATDTVAGVQYCEGSDWALNGTIFDASYGGYAYRNCTDWVAYRLKTNNGYTMPRGIGDASAWGTYFANHGVAVNTTPAVGAIAWAAGGDHVAYVEAVNGNQVTVSEYNYRVDPDKKFDPAAGKYWTNGAYDTRTVASGAFKYIHVKDKSPAQPGPYHAGRQVTIDKHATGGVSGHKGPGNSYATGPTHPANSAIWIVCYVNGQSIKGPYDTTTIWDLSDDGYYYTDAWLYTGTNGPAVPRCALKTVTVDKHATGGVSGHKGPGNSYAAGPTHAMNTPITIACYVNGQSIKGPYDTTTIWDLANDGYYYTDAWLYTGTNGPAVPHC